MEASSYQRSTSSANVLTAKSFERKVDDHSLRLILPPPRMLRDLPIGYQLGLPLLALTFVGIVGTMFDGSGLGLTMLPPAIFYGAAFCATLFFAVRHFLVRTCIEVTSSTLSVLRVFARSNRIIDSQIWRREQIGMVKRATGANHVVVHVLGRTMVEIPVYGEAGLAEMIADEINTAFQQIPIAQTGTPPSIARFEDDLPTPMRPGLSRSVLLGIAGVLGAIGLFIAAFGPPFCAISLLPFLLASVPAGIALGMQDKQYWQ